MTFKSKEQPLCRCCGRKIAKRTVSYHVSVGKGDRLGDSAYWKHLRVTRHPQTKEECQLLTNLQVVSIRRHVDGVVHFSAWDGESYESEFFCTNACAQKWGYVMAAAFPDKVSGAYNAAVAKRSEKEKA